MKSETRTELMAIPIVAIVFVVGIILLAASVAGAWAWVLIGVGGLGLLAILAVRYSRRNPHPCRSPRRRPRRSLRSRRTTPSGCS